MNSSNYLTPITTAELQVVQKKVSQSPLSFENFFNNLPLVSWYLHYYYLRKMIEFAPEVHAQ